LTVVAVLFFASASFAQTTQLTLTGVGAGTVVGNVYVDPYVGSVGGGPNTYVICDDWSDNTYVNETWTANVNTVPSVDSGTNSTVPLFGNRPTLYNEAAYLAAALLANTSNPTAESEISFALWQLTYSSYPPPDPEPQAPFAYLTSIGDGSTSTFQEGAQTWLTAALGESNYNAADWEILTPNLSGSQPSCSGSPCPSSPPQEFLVYTPESSSTILFGADMLGLLGLIVVFRRRLLRPIL
jgi:hypothetical protein